MSPITAPVDLLKQALHELQASILRTNYVKLPATWNRGKHVVPFNKMYYIVEGEGSIEVDGRVYHPKAGQLIVMPKGVPQAYSTNSANPFVKYWCHFHAHTEDSDLFSLFHFPVCIDVPDPGRVVQLFHQLVHHFQTRKPTSAPMLKAILTELICLFIDCTLEKAVPESEYSGNNRIYQIVKYMESNLSKKISLEELASQVHYHPNYFSRVFHTTMGVPPIHYLTYLRLERAKTLLMYTRKKVSEISVEVGLEHNFTTMFKQHTGHSPASYRKCYGISS